MKRILFVCHGNICRSPMAEFVLRHMARQEGLDPEVASAATSREEIGNGVHPGTKRKLSTLGISTAGKVARQMTREDYKSYDCIIAMDNMNIRNIMMIIGSDPEGKVCKLLSFAGEGGDIADPWYTGNFDETYDDVVRGCRGLLDYLRGADIKE